MTLFQKIFSLISFMVVVTLIVLLWFVNHLYDQFVTFREATENHKKQIEMLESKMLTQMKEKSKNMGTSISEALNDMDDHLRKNQKEAEKLYKGTLDMQNSTFDAIEKFHSQMKR